MSNPEPVARASRRRSSAESKSRIVRGSDSYTRSGEVRAPSHGEGLHSLHLPQWRQAHDAGTLVILERPRGRKRADPSETELEALRRYAEHAEAELVNGAHGYRGAGKRLGAAGRTVPAEKRGTAPSHDRSDCRAALGDRDAGGLPRAHVLRQEGLHVSRGRTRPLVLSLMNRHAQHISRFLIAEGARRRRPPARSGGLDSA